MKTKLSWDQFSKYRTELYGIATLMIMIFHCETVVPVKGIFNAVNSHLNYGVDVFLLLSGMSLYFSYSANSNYGTFLKKRSDRTLIPYLIIGLFFWIWKNILAEFDILDFLYNVSGLSLIFVRSEDSLIVGQPFIWYVAFIMGLYAVYPIIYNALFTVSEKKKYINFVLLFTLSIAFTFFLRFYANSTYVRTEVWLSRIPVFLIGCYIGKTVKDKKKFSLPDYILFFSVIPLKAIIILIRPVIDDYIFHRYLGIFGALFICFSAVLVFELISMKPIKRILSFFGKISLEIYIIHVMIYTVLLYYMPDMRTTDMFSIWQKILIYLGILIISTVLSFIFSKVLSYVREKRTIKK